MGERGEQQHPHADTVLGRILTWSKTRPLWQRDALRRIVLNGFPNEKGLSELLALCKKEHGDDLVEFVAVPLTQHHLPMPPGTSQSISLAEISNISGVNRLASDQNLSFAPKGITIVYGQNGTGKSGYTRILKKACRSRHAGEVMPDVYGSTPPNPAMAELTIISGSGNTQTERWENGKESPEFLSTITVFDREAASVHIRKKNEVWFRPFGLDVPDDLAGVCQSLKALLASEKHTLEQQRSVVFNSPPWSARSRFGAALSDLRHDIDLEAITPKGIFTPKDEARLAKLQGDIAQDPAVAAKMQHEIATLLDQMASYLTRIETALSVEAVRHILDKMTQADNARSVASAAAHEAFSGLSLEKVGESVWKGLWESARTYSSVATSDGRTFPPDVGDVCVLCHQEIDAQAATRMLGFEEFIKQDTEDKAVQSELALEVAKGHLRQQEIHIRKVSAAYRALKEIDLELAKKIHRYIAIARKRRGEILKLLSGEQKKDITNLPTSLAVELAGKAITIRAYASSLEGGSGSAAREAILGELAELNDLKHKNDFLKIAKVEITRLKALSLVEKCIGDTSTTAITRIGNEMADNLITPRMRDRFQQEITELAGSRVRVEVVRAGGKFGSPQYEVRLYASPKAKVHDVLSEGEQTCVALASYLTELANTAHTSTLVFDDPVSSLDHRWRTKVSKRLVKEARLRQVVVFTHDMIFVNDLHQMAGDQNVPVKLSHLTRGQDVVGIVNEALPWTATNLRDRIDKLEKSAREAKALFDAQDDEAYRTAAGTLYSNLRATWERALEDIVFANVIVRHRDYINTKRLKQVTALEENDVQIFQTGFQKCCDYVDAHDPSRGRDSTPPEPHEILQDIKALKDWSETLRTKMKPLS